MIGREARLFLQAVQLLTRLPTPRLTYDDPDALARSAKYFPMVGQIVGVFSGSILLLVGHLWNGVLPALLAIAAGILITGAFHEDGLADAADGLAGGRTREQILAIMKDSRIGTYGAIALGLCLALKLAALSSLGASMAGALALVAAHGGGRVAAVAVMVWQSYAGDPAVAKVTPVSGRVTTSELFLALLVGIWPLLFMRFPGALFASLLGGIAAAWPALTARSRIGGYTGDVLGAVEQAFEAGFLVGAAAFLSGS